ncbi:MAG: sulfurtransferase, partial [Chloroflexota bacterium]
STDWLNEHLSDPDVMIVDVRMPHFYGQGHLTGAISLPDVQVAGQGSVPVPVTAAQRLGKAGVRNDRHVVVYDDGASPAAAGVYFSLRYLRHHRVSVLDGGITKWHHEGRDLSVERPEREPVTYDFSEPDASLVASLDEVRKAIGDANSVILDVRSPAEYLGLQIVAYKNGHIPGAINLDWTNNLQASADSVMQLKADEELKSMYAGAGVTREKTVYVHCQSGSRSSETFLVLKKLGYPNVRHYTAGWQEWGNRPDTPVEER